MKIADSAIQLYSTHLAVEEHQKRESLTVWDQGQERKTRTDNEGHGREMRLHHHSASQASIKVSISAEAMKARPVKAVADPLSEEDEVMADLNIRILKAMIERITGKQIRLDTPENAVTPLTAGETAPAAPTPETSAPTDNALQGSGLIYDYYESHREYESTAFGAQGKILTEDGKEIDFSVQLNMSRSFITEQSLSIREGDALKDPLVINFGGQAAELTQTKFSFDIDSDGRTDQISFVGSNSGFLALDKNGDGSINNGLELFGAASGNGFAELAAYDLDGNNWIDENDSIYNQLRIWSKDGEGKDILVALGQKGIGAIYLGNVSTPFAIKDSDNTLQGQVRASGIFVNENGTVGTIQQLDLVA
ncbi:MAG: VCBS repeat-containing protein [Pseudomonadota bacterium]